MSKRSIDAYWIKSEEKYPIKLDSIRGMGLNGSN
jgi:hypothetical protein